MRSKGAPVGAPFTLLGGSTLGGSAVRVAFRLQNLRPRLAARPAQADLEPPSRRAAAPPNPSNNA
jgi:hypothetical protein